MPDSSDSSDTCGKSNVFKFGDLSFDSPADPSYPRSTPDLGAYEWEESPWETHMCSDYGVDECKYSWRCISCRMSYPKGDPAKFDSKDSKCRCYDFAGYPTDPREEQVYCPAYNNPF